MAYVLITGASSGIGRELAKKFAKRGFDLVLTARNTTKLAELKAEILMDRKVDIECFSYDLSLNNAPHELYEKIKEKNIRVSILVNNAGYGDYGKFIKGDIDKYCNMVDVNIRSLMVLTYLFIKDMKEDHYGHIINVASIAGFMPGPYMTVYYASKAFVLSFSLALKEELQEDDIKITTLCPGPVDTDFWDRAGTSMSTVKKLLFARKPSQVAKTALKAFDNNKGLVIDGALNKALVYGSRLLSPQYLARITGKIQSKLLDSGNKQ